MSGHPMTGRDPAVLHRLIAEHGDDVWLGPDGNADRGDRHHRPDLTRAANRKETPMTDKTPRKSATADEATRAVRNLVGAIRTIVLGRTAIDPIDASAPAGTQHKRIAAYNALHDLARPGHDRYCGYSSSALIGPCVLREGHADSQYDRAVSHMDVEARDRALRYLVHSDPNPEQRA